MTNPVLQAIADRRSNRGFDSEQISKKQLDALLKAALEAPSAWNSQPWHFSVVQSRSIIETINFEACKNINAELNDLTYGAPTMIFIGGDIDRDLRSDLVLVDCGIATQNIALAAHSLGLGSVIIAKIGEAFKGSKAAEFNELVKFPPGYKFVIAIAVGNPTVTKEAHDVKPDKVTIV